MYRSNTFCIGVIAKSTILINPSTLTQGVESSYEEALPYNLANAVAEDCFLLPLGPGGDNPAKLIRDLWYDRDIKSCHCLY